MLTLICLVLISFVRGLTRTRGYLITYLSRYRKPRKQKSTGGKKLTETEAFSIVRTVQMIGYLFLPSSGHDCGITLLVSWQLTFLAKVPQGSIEHYYRSGTLRVSQNMGCEELTTPVFSRGGCIHQINIAENIVRTDFYWDNTIASDLPLSAALLWLFGIWIIALLLFFSAIAKSGAAVLAGIGGLAVGLVVFRRKRL